MSVFQVGKTYRAKSVCDSAAVWDFKVESRSKSFVNLQMEDGSFLLRKVTQMDGHEVAHPLGRYSMAPVLRSSNVL